MTKAVWLRCKVIAAIIVLMIIVHSINMMMDGELRHFGLVPRRLDKWFHIFTAPFIHGDLAHLINNLVGLTVFSAFCLVRPVRYYIASSLFIIVCSGVLVWVFGREALHIGASGWVFGLWSLSIAMAWFERSLLNMLIAFIVIFFYGGMIYGVLPLQPGVSFEFHLFGLLSGFLCAAITRKIPNSMRENGRL